jgi:hypothetical protein
MALHQSEQIGGRHCAEEIQRERHRDRRLLALQIEHYQLFQDLYE